MSTVGKAVDRTSVAVTALTLILLASALAPLFVVEIPAMLDYPNHLARMYLLAGAPSPAYEAHWGVYPDLAMDLVTPALAHWMGVSAAAKVFLGLCEVLVVASAVTLEWVVKGRHRLGGLGALLVLFSLPFAWGQLNFMFGVGLATLGLALWIRLREQRGWLRWLVHAAVVAALFVAHFFDLGVYGLAIGLYELSRVERPLNLPKLLGLAMFMASPVVLCLVVMAFGGGGVGHFVGFDWDFGLKAVWAIAFMNVYDRPLAILTLVALAGLVAVLFATRRIRFTRAGAWIAGGLALAYLALPRQMFDSQYLDVRLLTVAAIILPAFLQTTLPSGFWRIAPLTAVVAIVAANQASTAMAWVRFQKDYQQVQASFPLLAPGSAVLVGLRDEAGSDNQPVFYAPTLAAPSAGVFVSSLYSEPGMQPMQPRPAYRALAVKQQHEYVPPRVQRLREALGGAASQPNIVDWPRRYQYLYLIGAGASNPFPGRLTLIRAGDRFSLFRISPPA